MGALGSLLNLLTFAPLKGYRTQTLGVLTALGAVAHFLMGDINIIQFANDLPGILGGLGLATLGAKVDAKAEAVKVETKAAVQTAATKAATKAVSPAQAQVPK